jgi:SAM-dependent methyltransferase
VTRITTLEPLEPAAVAARRAEFAVLDVREPRAFASGHLAGSGHVPLAELAERRSELPPRGVPLLVVADDSATARAAAQRLEGLGYRRLAWLSGRLADVERGEADRAPAIPLWRPSPFLEAVLPRLPDPAAGRKRVLDLAAGAGRESVFLALHGYEVEAWDHDRGALEKARALAGRHGVSLATRVQDLEVRRPPLPVEERDVVMVFRFLHRPLFPAIARALAPGGSLVYETYLKGQERFGKPKHPRFLLHPGELPRLVPELVVERYQEHTPEGGPLLARLLARRPG